MVSTYTLTAASKSNNYVSIITADGSSYAFAHLTLEEKEIQELGVLLRPYVHLQNINLSKNQLIDISELMHLPYLLQLNVSSNQIADVKFLEDFSQSLQYLQVSYISISQF